MLRLTLTAQTPQQTRLKIDGKITTDQVSLLVQQVRCLEQQSTTLVLVLDGVGHIDPEGLELFKRWTSRGVVLQGGTPFIRALLRSVGLESHAS